jgi:2-polyprenyl-3-methyl-5-hydroxy-6-metoxy-1,4-benzoquinol methylase
LRAIMERRKRRINSSLLPENIGPQITSIQPRFPLTKSIFLSYDHLMIVVVPFAARVILPELLDDALEGEAVPSLRDLVRINRYLGGYTTLRAMLGRIAGLEDAFSLLDVGAASGDMGAKVRAWYPDALVTTFDYRSNHLAAARGAKVVGDAFRLPFAAKSFDFVFCSLFLHHFENQAVTDLLSEFAKTARRAVLVIDLERGPLAYYFIPATQWLFHWDRITVHDAPVSVAAGFKRHELLKLADGAGLVNASVRVHRPWGRLSLIAPLT